MKNFFPGVLFIVGSIVLFWGIWNLDFFAPQGDRLIRYVDSDFSYLSKQKVSPFKGLSIKSILTTADLATPKCVAAEASRVSFRLLKHFVNVASDDGKSVNTTNLEILISEMSPDSYILRFSFFSGERKNKILEFNRNYNLPQRHRIFRLGSRCQ